MTLSAICHECGDDVFDVLPCIWDRCALEAESSDDELDALCVSMVLIAKMGNSRAREKLIDTTLSKALLAIRSDKCALRQMGTRALAETCAASPLVGMTAAIRNVIPMLGDMSDDWSRLGSCETLHRVITRVGQDIFPFAVFFVVPILGGMSDSIPAVREASTKCFGSLLRILPLEQGVADPEGLDADLMTSKATERTFLEQLLDTSQVLSSFFEGSARVCV